MIKSKILLPVICSFLLIVSSFKCTLPKTTTATSASSLPNVIFIYADDLGYGDLSSYGATKINTPNIDQLAKEGIRFTNAHSTSATCTPSRYGLMTGVYPWRRKDVAILPGDAALIIPTDKITLPGLFKKAGYSTGIVGKWHLGLGKEVEKNWNEKITSGPNDVGFDYSYIFPATADRVPTIFLENQLGIALDQNDPIEVNYTKKVGTDPTGKENPELLKMKSSPNHGHDNTIVNGIGRIGFMSGGQKARWTDEELTYTFLDKAQHFILENGREANKKPFFLYLSATEPHVPRMPATAFKGKSVLGYRGDAILQLDWMVGEIVKQIKALGIDKNTLIIFTSDNGPVLDDGYVDGAVTQQNGHLPAGPLRGGKYSAFEGGTRVPFIVSWPGTISPKVSPALISQIDMLATIAALTRTKILPGEAADSENMWDAFNGKSDVGRSVYIRQGGAMSIIIGDWKYIHPNKGPAVFQLTNIESGNLATPQLYNLKNDLGEKYNVAEKYPEKVTELADLLIRELSRNE
ncbi:MAG: arylsulfatase [Ginsengibacter sp.]